MNKQKIILRMTFLLCVAFLFSCASKPYNRSFSDALSVANAEVPKRKIVRTATISVEVSTPKDAAEKIINVVKVEGGYIENTRHHSNEGIDITIRIPADKLSTLLAKISGEGKVKSQSTYSRDVTEEVMDVDARLKNLIELRSRMRKLLDKASKVSEVLEIERELSRIQTQIDRIEGRRKLLSKQVTYSTLDLKLQKKTIYGPLGYLGKGIIELISKLFIISK